MGKGKLAKFADMEVNPLVVQCPFSKLQNEGFGLKGRWHEEFFKNGNPIVLELGCGRGEYTIGLARRFPEKNFIGVDIKGSRMWHGAQEAMRDGMTNVGFLRTNIECIHDLFAENEVAEIWLTFSDPQMKKPTKRLTSTYFMERYRKFLIDGGVIHLKTDSNFMYTYTRLMAEHNQLTVSCATDDLYHDNASFITEQLLGIRTYYEQMWLDRGITIKYIRFHLMKNGNLQEPDIEIEEDTYRSYGRNKRQQ